MTTEKGTIDQLLDFLRLDIKLTEKQRGALDALDWLYGPDVRTGRTTVIALQAIKAAMDSPGTKIVLHDHYSGVSGAECLVRAVRHFLEDLRPEVRGRFTTSKHGITFGRHSAPSRVSITYNVTVIPGENPLGTLGDVLRDIRANGISERHISGRRGNYLEEELGASGKCDLFSFAADPED